MATTNLFLLVDEAASEQEKFMERLKPLGHIFFDAWLRRCLSCNSDELFQGGYIVKSWCFAEKFPHSSGRTAIVDHNRRWPCFQVEACCCQLSREAELTPGDCIVLPSFNTIFAETIRFGLLSLAIHNLRRPETDVTTKLILIDQGGHRWTMFVS